MKKYVRNIDIDIVRNIDIDIGYGLQRTSNLAIEAQALQKFCPI